MTHGSWPMAAAALFLAASVPAQEFENPVRLFKRKPAPEPDTPDGAN